MRAVEFIKKYEITSALAAGFLDHLRRTPEEDVKEEILKNAYQEFSGINLDKIENSTWEQKTVHMEEEILPKEM
ncbi:hypothetical protein [Leptospira noguchii]|uniref:Uncharacterized protein n=2 Tax=Leptospira noguchii TaxID=28182 RepID=T0FK57_9LEPT|nr:hypothetical protein [Leptospira noguchii]EMO52950.1 hypothetical protein LEP1GSC172_2947 [Leptospira noguchii]EQA73778.1 hypothetical protein LEP1GSC059_4025 [Leptospira noguchii serovar Panama str. CZ214]